MEYNEILKRLGIVYEAIFGEAIPVTKPLKFGMFDKMSMGLGVDHEFNIEMSYDDVSRIAFEGTLEDTARFIREFLKPFEEIKGNNND